MPRERRDRLRPRGAAGSFLSRVVEQRLVTEAQARAVPAGARKTDATVNIENEPAISFWERQSFDRAPEMGAAHSNSDRPLPPRRVPRRRDSR